jgi:hypothetical protein
MSSSVDMGLKGVGRCSREVNHMLIWAVCGGIVVVFVWVVSQWDYRKKIRKQFKSAFKGAVSPKIE